MIKVAAIVICGILAASNALPRFHGSLFPNKIVGGEDAKQGELPYQIELVHEGYHDCGGSLVIVNNTQVVVTAAHCVIGMSIEGYNVVAGELKLSAESGLEQRRTVSRIEIHANYSAANSYRNDIAIMLPSSPFNITENVKPIALPSPLQQTNGSILVSGWGTTHGGNDPDTLQKVELPVVSDEDCQKAYSDRTLLPSMLCAGYLGEGGKDSCQGDSGGPLAAANGSYLAGIVSWGRGCADPDYPGVNTEVSYFIDWIEDRVKSFY